MEDVWKYHQDWKIGRKENPCHAFFRSGLRLLAVSFIDRLGSLWPAAGTRIGATSNYKELTSDVDGKTIGVASQLFCNVFHFIKQRRQNCGTYVCPKEQEDSCSVCITLVAACSSVFATIY